MSNQNNIGDRIRDAVEDAINSQDFSKLNETVSKSIGTAAENFSRSMKSAAENSRRLQEQAAQSARRAAESARQAAENQRRRAKQRTMEEQAARREAEERQQLVEQRRQDMMEMQRRYLPANSMKTSGYFMAFGGGILSFLFAVGTLGSLTVTAFTGTNLGGFLIMLLCLGASLGLMTVGVKRVGLARRFQNYIRIIGRRTYCDIKELASRTGKPENFIVKNVKKMLGKGLFRQGRLDQQESCLMVTEEAYHQYQISQNQLEERKKQEELVASFKKAQEREETRSAEVQSVLDEGNAYLAKIRASNEAIRGEAISAKISRMETIVEKIFQRVKEQPEVIPDLKKLMEYYLPTTVKLLDAYENLEHQPIQGENIRSSKKEIEDTLDTLNIAFEKLLDSIFRDMAWDVSTDISVLHTILAQEGLTDDAFKDVK